MNNKPVGSAFFDLRDICEGVRGRLIRSMIREVVSEAIQQSAYLVEDKNKETELVAEYCASILQVTRVTEDVTRFGQTSSASCATTPSIGFLSGSVNDLKLNFLILKAFISSH